MMEHNSEIKNDDTEEVSADHIDEDLLAGINSIWDNNDIENNLDLYNNNELLGNTEQSISLSVDNMLNNNSLEDRLLAGKFLNCIDIKTINDKPTEIKQEIKEQIKEQINKPTEVKEQIKEQINKPTEIKQEIKHVDKSELKIYLNKITDKTKLTLFNKIAGLVYGCALGDCVGKQLKGRKKESITKFVAELPNRSYRGIDSGDWTDDTDHLILLLINITNKKLSFSVNKFVNQLVNWRNKGFYEVGDSVGIGIDTLTAQVLNSDKFVTDPFTTSINVQKKFDPPNRPYNTSIARSGILILNNNWSHHVITQCALTHADNRSIYVSWLLAYICKNIFIGNNISIDKLFVNKDLFIKGKEVIRDFAYYENIFKTNDKKILLEKLKIDDDPTYHAFKTLGCMIYTIRYLEEKQDFKELIYTIMNECGDSDTNCAVVGEIIGTYLGYDKLPIDWLNELVNRTFLDRKLIELFKLFT